MVGYAVIMASSKLEMEPVISVATLKKTEIYGDEEQTAALFRCTLHVLNLFFFFFKGVVLGHILC